MRQSDDVTAFTCANLRKATRAVTQAYNTALRPIGLTTSRFSLLATLAALGEVAMTRLAAALVMDRTTLTRNLKPLVARALVRIDPGEDQRVSAGSR